MTIDITQSLVQTAENKSEQEDQSFIHRSLNSDTGYIWIIKTILSHSKGTTLLCNLTKRAILSVLINRHYKSTIY